MLATQIIYEIGQRNVTIAIGETIIVDTVKVDNIKSRFYIVNLDTSSLSQSLLVFAKPIDGDIDYTRSNVLGNDIDYTMDFNINAGMIEFSIKNNTVNVLNIKLQYIK